MRFDGQADVVEEIDHFLRVSEVSGLNITNVQIRTSNNSKQQVGLNRRKSSTGGERMVLVQLPLLLLVPKYRKETCIIVTTSVIITDTVKAQ